MSVKEWVELILQILSGIIVCIPLVIKLCKLVKECHQAKAWKPLLELLLRLMQEAENKFEDGATRKEYVMAMVQTSAEYVNCPIDLSILSAMIDGFCDFTKVVNPPEPDIPDDVEPDAPDVSIEIEHTISDIVGTPDLDR